MLKKWIAHSSVCSFYSLWNLEGHLRHWGLNRCSTTFHLHRNLFNGPIWSRRDLVNPATLPNILDPLQTPVEPKWTRNIRAVFLFAPIDNEHSQAGSSFLTSLRITQTGESVITERRMASRGPKVGSTSPSAIPFWNVPERDEDHEWMCQFLEFNFTCIDFPEGLVTTLKKYLLGGIVVKSVLLFW